MLLARTIAVSHFVQDLVGIKANVAMRYVTKMNQMPRLTRMHIGPGNDCQPNFLWQISVANNYR